MTETSEPVVVREIQLDTSSDELWSLLTDARELATWLGTDVELDPIEGGIGSLLDGEVLRRLVVDEVVPGQRIGFVWWPDDAPEQASTVTFTIAGDGEQSTLRVVERPVAAGAARACSLTGAEALWDDRLLGLELRLITRAAALVGAGLAHT